MISNSLSSLSRWLVICHSEMCVQDVCTAFDYSHLQCLSVFSDSKFLQISVGDLRYGAQCTYYQEYYLSSGIFSLVEFFLDQSFILLFLLFQSLVDVLCSMMSPRSSANAITDINSSYTSIPIFFFFSHSSSSSIIRLNKNGDSGHPCFTPEMIFRQLVFRPPMLILVAEW